MKNQGKKEITAIIDVKCVTLRVYHDIPDKRVIMYIQKDVIFQSTFRWQTFYKR